MRRLAFLTFGLTAALFAQEFRATISGSVTDPQGAAVPGVKVVATETRTNTRSAVTSAATGEYIIPFLRRESTRSPPRRVVSSALFAMA
jgi:hypothetical protein